MFCNYCGKEMADASAFCGNCGKADVRMNVAQNPQTGYFQAAPSFTNEVKLDNTIGQQNYTSGENQWKEDQIRQMNFQGIQQRNYEVKPKKSKKWLYITLPIVLILVVGTILLLTVFSPEARRERLAKNLLEAIFTGESELAEDCVPPDLQKFYKRAIRDLGWDFVDSVDITLSEERKLNNKEIREIEEEYDKELNHELLIEEAYEYEFEIVAYFKDHGEDDTEDEDGRVIVAKIEGEWYAIVDDPGVID